MQKLFRLSGCTVLASMWAISSQAHHSFAMYDQAKTLTWHATIKDFEWLNPHCHIHVMSQESKDDPVTLGDWDIEAAAPNILARQGWDRNALRAGDKVTIVGHPMRSGAKVAALMYVIIGDKTLYNNTERPGGAAVPDSPVANPKTP
jgi:hypothetical protein